MIRNLHAPPHQRRFAPRCLLLLALFMMLPESLSATEPEAQLLPSELSLEGAIELALHNNRSIRDADFGIASTEQGLTAAREAFAIKVRPLSNITYSRSDEQEVSVWEVGGSIAKTFSTGIRVAVEPSIAKGDDQYDADLGCAITVPLLRGFGREAVLDEVYGNRFALITARRSLLRQQVDTVVETVAAVYNLIKDEQLIALYQQQLAELSKQLKLTHSKEQVGLARAMDVYRVEIRIKEVEDSLNLARERWENDADQLKGVLALPLEQSLVVRAPLHYTLIDIELDEAVRVALANRVELRQAQADIEEAQRKARLAEHNILPDLQLEAAYRRGGRFGDDTYLPDYDENLFSISLSSSSDLSRSVEKARWEQSRIAVNRRHLQFAAVEEGIVRDVRRVLNALDKSAQRIALRRQQIAQATGKFRLAQVKFRHGEADNFDLIESQGQLQQARADLVGDELQYIVNGYRLRAAMGTLIDAAGG